jgi:hypothetical protein
LVPSFRDSLSKITCARDPSDGRKIGVKSAAGISDNPAQFIRQIEELRKFDHPCVSRVLDWRVPTDLQCGEIHTECAEHGSLESVIKLELLHSFWNANGKGINIR